MAKENKVEEISMEEYVDYVAPLMPDLKDQTIFVAVNGETIHIKRGEVVRINRKFVEALNNASKQEYAAMRNRMVMQEQAKKPIADM